MATHKTSGRSSSGARIAWAPEELAQLVNWIERNPSEITKKRKAWSKQAKLEVFPKDDHITPERILNKVRNLQALYKTTYEEMAILGNPTLQGKCPHFSQLDALWSA